MSVTKADISLATYLTMARKKAGYNSPYDAERAAAFTGMNPERQSRQTR